MSENAEQNSTTAAACPPTRRTAATGRVRPWAALILVGCLAPLGLATYLKPNPNGYGTHSQLGTGPCGMLVMTGYPCPTCGMTTAYAHFVRGQWTRAIWVQPAGFLLALGTTALALVSAWCTIAGRWPRIRVWFLTPYRLFLALLVLLLAGWAFKIVTGLVDGSLPYPGRG